MRFQFSLYHSWILRNQAVLREGSAVIDLLNGGSLNGSTQARHTVQFNAGLVDNGLGLRLSGSWKSATRITTGEAAGNLRFAPLMSLDLRLFANLASRFPFRAWARGTRSASRWAMCWARASA
jgi:hypothetical protein